MYRVHAREAPFNFNNSLWSQLLRVSL